MSFQNTTHVVQEFVPTYTVKSEYLPTNRVLDGKQAETTEWVWFILLFSSEDMKNKKDQEKSSLKNQLSSTQIDTSQSELMRTLESTSRSQSNNSKPKSPELEDIDHF